MGIVQRKERWVSRMEGETEVELEVRVDRIGSARQEGSTAGNRVVGLDHLVSSAGIFWWKRERLTLVVGIVRRSLVVAHIVELRVVLVLLLWGQTLLGLSRGSRGMRGCRCGGLRLFSSWAITTNSIWVIRLSHSSACYSRPPLVVRTRCA